VFGGFSAKTLSDRIADAGAKIRHHDDGAYRNAQVVGFKEPSTDRALDDYVPLPTALANRRRDVARGGQRRGGRRARERRRRVDARR